MSPEKAPLTYLVSPNLESKVSYFVQAITIIIINTSTFKQLKLKASKLQLFYLPSCNF